MAPAIRQSRKLCVSKGGYAGYAIFVTDEAVKIYDCKYVTVCDTLNTYEAVTWGRGREKQTAKGRFDVYESFLNGELTVAFEEQQIYISDLFWDNDKESVWQQESVYCVFLQWYSQKWAGGSAKRNPSYGCPVC